MDNTRHQRSKAEPVRINVRTTTRSICKKLPQSANPSGPIHRYQPWTIRPHTLRPPVSEKARRTLRLPRPWQQSTMHLPETRYMRSSPTHLPCVESSPKDDSQSHCISTPQ
ncbi:hypothetical protein C8Q80DRAFT_219251 [Daedaleopsis nitida]|nr:hypothetical protein C8Q80DRAFT_219251 [Daedaleopsis nitida]